MEETAATTTSKTTAAGTAAAAASMPVFDTSDDFDAKTASEYDNHPAAPILAKTLAQKIASWEWFQQQQQQQQQQTGGGGLKILDYGCGTGNVALRLLEHGHFVTGVDPSASMLQVFESKIKQHTTPSTTTTTIISESEEPVKSFRPEQVRLKCSNSKENGKDLLCLLQQEAGGDGLSCLLFDVILVAFVLHHIPSSSDRTETVSNLVELLKPDGVGKLVIAEFHDVIFHNSSDKQQHDHDHGHEHHGHEHHGHEHHGHEHHGNEHHGNEHHGHGNEQEQVGKHGQGHDDHGHTHHAHSTDDQGNSGHEHGHHGHEWIPEAVLVSLLQESCQLNVTSGESFKVQSRNNEATMDCYTIVASKK